jgi:hypothetical protein
MQREEEGNSNLFLKKTSPKKEKERKKVTCTEQLNHHHQRGFLKKKRIKNGRGGHPARFLHDLGLFDLKVMLLTGKRENESVRVCVTRTGQRGKKIRNKGQIIHGPSSPFNPFLLSILVIFPFFFFVNSGGLAALYYEAHEFLHLSIFHALNFF